MLKDYEWDFVMWNYTASADINGIQEAIIGIWNGVQLHTGKLPRKPISVIAIPDSVSYDNNYWVIVSHGVITESQAIEYYNIVMEKSKVEFEEG